MALGRVRQRYRDDRDDCWFGSGASPCRAGVQVARRMLLGERVLLDRRAVLPGVQCPVG